MQDADLPPACGLVKQTPPPHDGRLFKGLSSRDGYSIRLFHLWNPILTNTRPETFDSLTGLRFLLSIWIAVFHLGDMYDHAGFGSWPIMKAGVARVDIFFVLSGFVLAHIYWARSKAKFHFPTFMRARFARLYPLHLLALAILAGLVLAAHLVGKGDEARNFTTLGLVANIFLLQAWGVPGAGVWNFPGWTISAEFFGYLLFPAFLWIAAKLRHRPWLFLFLSVALVLLIDLGFRLLLGRTMTQSTADLGILRGASVILVGVAARVVFETWHLSSRNALRVLLFGALIAVSGAFFGLTTAMVALGGALLVIGLAARDVTKPTSGVGTGLDAPLMVRLGGWSYAIFILHVPVFMATQNLAGVLGTPIPINLLTIVVMVGLLMLVSALAHYVIEEPARLWLRGSSRRAQ